jgi:hypothetical protein
VNWESLVKDEAEPRRLRLITLHDASLQWHMHAAAQKVKFRAVRLFG